MKMPYTDFAKCFLKVLSKLTPNPIESNFNLVKENPEFGDCLDQIDREKSYQLLSDDIAPSLLEIEWYQKYEQLEALARFIDDRDMESYCAFKFRIFVDDYPR